MVQNQKEIKVPNKYFFDFLRGHYDRDIICLKRKRDKVEKALKINTRAGVVMVAEQA